jgi:hypothetical protein
MNRLFPFLIIGAIVPVAAWSQTPNRQKQLPPPAKLSLDDQFERSHDMADHAGDVVVILYGDRQGMPANKEIGETIHAHYHPTAKGQPPGQARKAPVTPLPNLPEGKRSPDVKIIPVACFGNVPPVIRNVIRNQVKKNAAETTVWLDFEDKMKDQFGLTPGVPNMAIIDAQGRVRHRAAGDADAKSIKQMIEAIDLLRNEAAGIGP